MNGFGVRLKQARGAISQAAFAKQLGISQVAYSRYELDQREPSLDMLYRIGIATGASADWLLGFPNRNAATVTSNSGAVAIEPQAKAKCTILRDTSPQCETCKYKKFAEAFKAIQSPS